MSKQTTTSNQESSSDDDNVFVRIPPPTESILNKYFQDGQENVINVYNNKTHYKLTFSNLDQLGEIISKIKKINNESSPHYFINKLGEMISKIRKLNNEESPQHSIDKLSFDNEIIPISRMKIDLALEFLTKLIEYKYHPITENTTDYYIISMTATDKSKIISFKTPNTNDVINFIYNIPLIKLDFNPHHYYDPKAISINIIYTSNNTIIAKSDSIDMSNKEYFYQFIDTIKLLYPKK